MRGILIGIGASIMLGGSIVAAISQLFQAVATTKTSMTDAHGSAVVGVIAMVFGGIIALLGIDHENADHED